MLRGGARVRATLLAKLSLPANADHAAVKARYRELAKQHHPDVNPKGGGSAAAAFAELTDAYQQLMGGADADAETRGDVAQQTHDPAMQARWNIRRRAKASEYPAWFTPPTEQSKDEEG